MMWDMLFRHELAYDATPAQVFAMLADPVFREAACAARDVVAAEVTLTRVGNGFTLVVDEQQPTGDLPSLTRPWAGGTIQVLHREEWADSISGTLRIESPGKPWQFFGTVTLRPEGSRTLEIVELDARIRVPLIGHRLEKLVADKVRSGMDAEHGVGVAYLAGGR